MPAKSQQQLKLIYAKRNQYKNKKNTPKKWKWIWEEDWTDVKYKDLPEKVEESVKDRFSSESNKLIKIVNELANFHKITIPTTFIQMEDEIRDIIRDYKLNIDSSEIKSVLQYINENIVDWYNYGNKYKVEESNFDRGMCIDMIYVNSDHTIEELEKMSDEEIKKICIDLDIFFKDDDIDEFEDDDIDEFEDDEELYDYNENNIITKFDNFLLEKKSSGQKLTFDEWWSRSYEKKSDYWVSKQEIRQGYQPNELTHYYDKKMRSKYYKYLYRKNK